MQIPYTIDFFNHYLKQYRSLSQSSIDSYNVHIKLFHDFLFNKYFGEYDITKITLQDVMQFVDILQRKPRGNSSKYAYISTTVALSKATVKFYVNSIRQYMSYLYAMGHSVIKDIPSPRVKKTVKISTISDDEFDTIIKCCENEREKERIARNKLLFYLGWHCGLRIQEVLNIRFCDIQCETRKLFVTRKGGQRKHIQISDEIVSLVRQMQTFRQKAQKSYRYDYVHKSGTVVVRKFDVKTRGYIPSDFIFISMDAKNYGHQFTQNGVTRIMRIYGEQVRKRITYHMLRHSFATRIYEKTGDIMVTKELMDHSSIISTQIYTNVCNVRASQVLDLIYS